MSKETNDAIIAQMNAHEEEHVVYQQKLKDDHAATKKLLDAALLEIEELKKPKPTEPPKPTSKTLFGAGGGNKDRSKDGIGIDRRYYGANDIGKAVADAKRNHAAGILTWVSFKCPFSWIKMHQGEGDVWAKDALAMLVAPGFVIWVSFHHEPEGDADEDDWRLMQDRLSRLVPGGVEGNVKFFLTTTGWGQEFNAKRVIDEVDWETNLFPHGAPIYGIAYDAPYNTFGVETATGKMNNSWTDPHTYVDKLAARGVQFGVKVAIGEMGYSNEAFAKDKTWLAKVFDRAIEKGLLGVCYFDTTLNSSKSWTLGAAGSAKRAYFNELVKARNV